MAGIINFFSLDYVTLFLPGKNILKAIQSSIIISNTLIYDMSIKEQDIKTYFSDD